MAPDRYSAPGSIGQEFHAGDDHRLQNNYAVLWLNAFRARHGRPPRILHLGNIANNAYVNAKMLNDLGYDCDVLCNDYYHIMGAPEWEDVDFQFGPPDHNLPDWSEIDLGGYQRPRWFAQGPLPLCVAYLLARRHGETTRADRLWSMMQAANRTVHAALPLRMARLLRARLASYDGRPLVDTARQMAIRLVGAGLDPPSRALRYLLAPLALVAAAGLLSAARLSNWPNYGKIRASWDASTFDAITRDYPDVAWHGIKPYLDAVLPYFTKLFGHYDIVHAYATAPIMPLLVGKRPYVAYEHGTIREIPFEPNPIGRLTFEAYRRADMVILTNADALESLPRVRDMNRPYLRALHGFDERTIQRRLAVALAKPGRRPRFGVDPAQPLFFSPSRHDWAVKGNDVMLRAMALVHARGAAPKLVLVRWGQEIDRSERLIVELGIADHVKWAEPLGKFELLAAFHDADAVVDQFILPHLGAISVEVMSIGRAALIISVDQDLMERFYGAHVPLYSARTAEEVAAAMVSVIADRKTARATAAAARDWVLSHHSHEQVLNYLGRAYAGAAHESSPA